ncbi:MAG: DsbA family protein, partial [Acidimicrobiia bacterium]
MTPGPATFYYDFNSPYAYFSATRVDDVMATGARWQPIAFAFLLIAHQRVPWSLESEGSREAGKRECEARAERYGLPAMAWPPGWPRESYSVAPLRAALVAERAGRLKEFSLAAYERNFVTGEGLRGLEDILAVARVAGVAEQAVREGLEDPSIKGALKGATDSALAAGVHGVPTVAVGDQLFWGDDRL